MRYIISFSKATRFFCCKFQYFGTSQNESEYILNFDLSDVETNLKASSRTFTGFFRKQESMGYYAHQKNIVNYLHSYVQQCGTYKILID